MSRVPGASAPALAGLLVALVALFGAVPATAQGGTAADGSPGTEAARQYFTDTVLLNQDGEPMEFYSDVMAGKSVIINTLFTTCTGVCPMMGKTLARVQEHLGDRVGDDVVLVSISVDPVTDTPRRMKALAESFGARDGWYFLTGEPADVELVLSKLGQAVADKEAHSNVLLIGNDRTGLWKKAMGLAPVADLLPIVDSVVDDRGES